MSIGCMTFFIIISKIIKAVKICVSFKTIQQEVNVSEKLFGFVFIFMLIHVKKVFNTRTPLLEPVGNLFFSRNYFHISFVRLKLSKIFKEIFKCQKSISNLLQDASNVHAWVFIFSVIKKYIFVSMSKFKVLLVKSDNRRTKERKSRFEEMMKVLLL